ncbi:MAG: OmpH family outer membrane protein [Candidatus Aphodosoma sp.]
MMRRFVLLLLGIVAITASAQDSAAVVRIGYIDKKTFVQTMPEMQAVEAELQELQAEYEQEFRSMTDSYNDRVRVYLEKKNEMSEAMKLARQTEITELEATIDLYKRRYLEDLDTKRIQLTTPIVEAVDAAIAAVARNMGLAIVFDHATPLYVSDDCVDITEAVSLQFAR